MACVYALVTACEPENYRYIGKTIEKPHRRLSKHYTSARTGESTYVYRWMRRRMSEGKSIEIVILEDNLTYEESGVREIFFIKKFKEEGYRLTNATDGGDGGRLGSSGWKHTEETLAKMRGYKPWLVGRKDSPETREKKRLSSIGNKSNTGKKASEEARANMRAAQAKRTTEDWQAANEKARLARLSRTPEQIQQEHENRSRALKGKPRIKGRKVSEEVRANMRAIQARRTPEDWQAANEKARLTRLSRTPEQIQQENENRKLGMLRRTPEQLARTKEKTRMTRLSRTPEQIQQEHENRSRALKGIVKKKRTKT